MICLQYGSGRIAKAEQKRHSEENLGEVVQEHLPPSDGDENQAGHAIIKSSVINKEDLVLVPNGNASCKSTALPRNRSYNTLKHEFILSDCLDFFKAGVEAIIEDEVTQRFIAEDLKV